MYTDAVHLLSKLSPRAQSIQRTNPRASKHRAILSFLLSTFLSLSSLRRAILHLRLGLPSLDRSVSNLDTLLPERSLVGVPARIAS